MTLPTFLGIGAPKSGTTWLAKCLGEHPQVYMAPAKELVFFDYGDYDQRLPEYERHFAGVRSETAIGEFTTRYLASERPAPRIRELIPQARLLVCLRNPADQIYSHYWHLLRQNFHQPTVQADWTFEEALERFPHLLLKPVRYWDQLQYWLGFFPAEQFLVLLYDDIQRTPEATLAKVFDFLGVDSTFVPPSTTERGTAVRSGAAPRSTLAGRVHARVYTQLNRWFYQPLKRSVGVRRAHQLKEAIRIRHLLETVFFRRGYPAMNADTRKRLAREFADQVEGIEQFLGRTLGEWK